jgi:diadenosine tetraphosphate (Ap4A) HIT family hydrolase
MSSGLNEQNKQAFYRDARFTDKYDGVWQNVGKCAFCELNEKYIFYEENDMVLTVAVYAYIDGHCMIIPRRHIKSIKELTAKEWETVRKLTYLAKKAIREIYGIKGMQIIQKDGADAQSTVEHLHIHCIPFDSPDLCAWNYRKLKNTPKENASKYKSYHPKLKSLAKRFGSKYD